LKRPGPQEDALGRHGKLGRVTFVGLLVAAIGAIAAVVPQVPGVADRDPVTCRWVALGGGILLLVGSLLQLLAYRATT
jgi:hypothetical protein